MDALPYLDPAPQATVELTGVSATASMQTRRRHHTLTLLENGDVLAVAGDGGGGPRRTADLFVSSY